MSHYNNYRVLHHKILNSYNDAAKLNTCDDVIKALKSFIQEHPDGEWNITAKSALQDWQVKRAEIQENINRKIDFDKIKSSGRF